MQPAQPEQIYRDTFATSTREGGRRWLYPEVVKGNWFNRRGWVAYLLLASLLAGPFWQWNGHPVFLFDVLNRQFIVFGIGFGPQDMPLLVLGILTFVVFIFAFTQVFGRLWCGWACPQTIFMEWIFRPVESLIEGNAIARKRLDEEPPSPQKSFKKGFKYLVFWVISFGLANVFLAYLIGSKELHKLMTDNPKEHWIGLLVLLIFTCVFFFVYTRLRELVCTLICPYGRLQSTLNDLNSLAVSYDMVRGEPRGHKKTGTENLLGDCVDCNWCVKVCPTGIDIRNGIQMECIQCTACIDACDMVMAKTHRPPNLIGYFSENQIKNRSPFLIKLKGMAYFGLWFVLMGLFVSLIFTRTAVETQILRTPGNTGFSPERGRIANLYNFEMVNKTFENQEVEIVTESSDYKLEMVGKARLRLAPHQVLKGTFFISTYSDENNSKSLRINLLVRANGKITDQVQTRLFYVPKQPI